MKIKNLDKTIDISEASKVAKRLHKENKSIVLAGGCFDILHVGHVTFLEQAKKNGDILMVFLENDDRVRKIKGKMRPINTQENRARVLSALSHVDYIITLPSKLADKIYDEMVIKIRPDILATTKGDSQRHHKERQAKLVGARVVDVIGRFKDQSTTRLATLLKEEYGL